MRAVIACVSLAAAVLLLRETPAAAQAPGPFSRIEVSTAGSVNVNRERLHDLWGSDPGGLVRFATPFHVGSIALSAELTPFAAIEPGLPDFDALAVALEWGVERTILPGFRGSVGVQIGNMRFAFIDPESGELARSESELLLGVRAGLRQRVVGLLGLTAEAHHQRVFTRLPIDLTFASVGLDYSFDAPRWLREFLQ